MLLEQGVTTVVAGNCGFSPAPVRRSRLDLLDESLAAMLAGGRLGYDWTSMGGFLERVEKSDPVVNLAELVGHSSVRFATSDTRRGPMPSDELMRCLDEVRRSFDEGACGLSFGLGYDPAMYSPLEELEAFCRVAAEAARPVTVHLKALSAISPTYPVATLQAHNLRALRLDPGKAEELGEDAVEAVRLLTEHLQEIDSPRRRAAGLPLPSLFLEHLDRCLDRSQRVADLVGQAGAHSAQRCQTFGPPQLLLHFE